jgi:hypothetical protein
MPIMIVSAITSLAEKFRRADSFRKKVYHSFKVFLLFGVFIKSGIDTLWIMVIISLNDISLSDIGDDYG